MKIAGLCSGEATYTGAVEQRILEQRMLEQNECNVYWSTYDGVRKEGWVIF